MGKCLADKLPLRALSILFLAVVVYAPAAYSQVSPHSAFLQNADDAFQAGLSAAKNHEWDRAIELFFKSHQINEENANPRDLRDWRSRFKAPVLLNLGLAHANAGHDLIAMAWLHAYIAAAPDAPDAPDVAKTINQLKARAQQRIRDGLRAMGDFWPLTELEAYRSNSGPLATSPDGVEISWQEHAITLARNGDITGASAALEYVKTLSRRDKVFDQEWYFFINEIPDYDAALAVANRISDPDLRAKRINETATSRQRWNQNDRVRLTGQGWLVGEWVGAAETLSSHHDYSERDNDVLFRFDLIIEKIRKLPVLSQQQSALHELFEAYARNFNTILRRERAQEYAARQAR